jgi:hypothetical protein
MALQMRSIGRPAPQVRWRVHYVTAAECLYAIANPRDRHRLLGEMARVGSNILVRDCRDNHYVVTGKARALPFLSFCRLFKKRRNRVATGLLILG